MTEIRIHGRGGQGAVGASKMLADAAFREGRYVQAFPQYGVERRGAPVQAFARIAEPGETLFVRSQIYRPDCLVVLDPTLLVAENILLGLKEGGVVLVNTPLPPEELELAGEPGVVATVDASRIALDNGLGTKTQPIVNTAILGALARILDVVELDSLLSAVEEGVPVKARENASACRRAFDECRVRTGQGVGA